MNTWGIFVAGRKLGRKKPLAQMVIQSWKQGLWGSMVTYIFNTSYWLLACFQHTEVGWNQSPHIWWTSPGYEPVNALAIISRTGEMIPIGMVMQQTPSCRFVKSTVVAMVSAILFLNVHCQIGLWKYQRWITSLCLIRRSYALVPSM